MSYSRFSAYKHIYTELLPVFVPCTTFLGLLAGLSSPLPSYAHLKQLDFFTSVIGHTTIGIFTGVLFPITYPLIGGYVLYKNYLQTPSKQ